MKNGWYNSVYMNKSKAIIKFCIIGFLVAVGLTLCFAKFRVPTTEYNFVGFYNAIKSKMGIDLNGGVLAVFDCEQEGSGDFSKEVDATITRIENLLTAQGFVEATVTRQGTAPNYKIRIEVPGMEETTEIFDAIGEPATIEFMNPTSDQTEAQTYKKENIFMDGKAVQRVEAIPNPDTGKTDYVIQVHFTTEGTNLFTSKVKEAGGQYLAIFSNETLIFAPTISSENASTLGADGTVIITGSYTKEQAEQTALKIESGLYTVGLTASETSIIPATLGEGALLAGIIALLVGIGFIFLIMWLLYGDLGLLSNLSLLVYTIIFLFFLAMIDSVQLTLPGIAGIILSLGMAVDANVIIFEQIKDEFKSGKRFAPSVKGGFDKSIKTILDANITTIIASGVLYILGTGSIKGFAITLFLGVAISMFVSLLVTRSFAKLYLYINPENPNRARLKSAQPENNTHKIIKSATKRKLNMGGAKNEMV
jgi:preprotein translocase subunit SecD